MQVSPIKLEEDQLQVLFAKLEVALRDAVDSTLQQVDRISPEVQLAVERRVLKEFCLQFQSIVRSNSTLAATIDAGDASNDLEPFDEKANREMMRYSLKVHDSVLENTIKRKEAPKKAQAALEMAIDHWRAIREAKIEIAEAERKSLQAGGKGNRKYTNASIPDREDVFAKYTTMQATVDALVKHTALEAEKARQAGQAQDSIQEYIQHVQNQTMEY